MQTPGRISPFKCDHCDQFVKYIYPKTCLVELVDAPAIPIVWHYGKQRQAITKN